MLIEKPRQLRVPIPPGPQKSANYRLQIIHTSAHIQREKGKKKKKKTEAAQSSPLLIVPQDRLILQIRPPAHPPMRHIFKFHNDILLTLRLQGLPILLLQFRRAVFFREEAGERNGEVVDIFFRQTPVFLLFLRFEKTGRIVIIFFLVKIYIYMK